MTNPFSEKEELAFRIISKIDNEGLEYYLDNYALKDFLKYNNKQLILALENYQNSKHILEELLRKEELLFD